MQHRKQSNAARTAEVLDKVALLLSYPEGEKNSIVCLLGDIALSLSAIADSLTENNLKSNKENKD